MYSHLEAELCAHDADGQPQVSRRADGDGVPGEKLTEAVGCEYGVVVAVVQITVLYSNVLCGFEHLVDPAARLDGAGYGQVAVLFQPQPAGQGEILVLLENLLHCGDGKHIGLDYPV